MREQPLEFDRANLGAILVALTALLRRLVVVELALDTLDLALEDVDLPPEQIVEVGLEPGVGQVETRASKMSATAPPAQRGSGNGLGSGSSWNGRQPKV